MNTLALIGRSQVSGYFGSKFVRATQIYFKSDSWPELPSELLVVTPLQKLHSVNSRNKKREGSYWKKELKKMTCSYRCRVTSSLNPISIFNLSDHSCSLTPDDGGSLQAELVCVCVLGGNTRDITTWRKTSMFADFKVLNDGHIMPSKIQTNKCRTAKKKRSISSLNVAWMQMMRLSQFFSCHVFFFNAHCSTCDSPCYCKCTVCTHNKLLITDVEVTFDLKYLSALFYFFGILHV